MKQAWRMLPIAIVMALVDPRPAFACRCTEPSLKTAYSKADAVALVRIDQLSEPSSDGTVTAQAEVLNAWKTKLPSKLHLVTGEDCAYPFKANETYLVYLSRGQDVWGTYQCRGNRLSKQAASNIRWLDQNARGSASPK